MKKQNLLFLFLLIASTSLFAQNQFGKSVKSTKNVILMIPDGCSLPVYSAARWYQIYNKLGSDKLAVDPFFCGTVKTYNSNSPIGDSAPTTSTYMTGYLGQAGNVATYPVVDELQDIHAVDPTKAYQPLMTILEAARITKNKAVGLVATAEFCHATPADCSSHYYNRAKYDYLVPQQIANGLNVVIAGGNKYLTEAQEDELTKKGTKVIRNDVKSLRAYSGDQDLWALYNDVNMPYDIDRDNNETPSLAEMTEKAISRLSKDPNGFFLMVEGSQVDWSAHANDAATMITEYLAFDRAVASALEFAKKDGNTTVIVVSDHGNSGFTIGRYDALDYAKKGLDYYFKNVSKVKASTRKLEELILAENNPNNYSAIFEKYAGISIDNADVQHLLEVRNFTEEDYMKKGTTVTLMTEINQILNRYNYFGFSTGGHSGEDVILAVYHPQNDLPIGMLTNIDLHKYMCDAVGLDVTMDALNEKYFAKHSNVFQGMKCTIDVNNKTYNYPTLIVEKGKNRLEIPAFGATAYLNKKAIDLKSVVVYVDKNDTFYLPVELKDML